jgi:hypothetical protein
MLVFKIVLYIMTLAAMFLFALRERKLKEELTDDLLEHPHENVSDFDSVYEIRKEIRRERILRDIPNGAKSKLNIAIGLKFLFGVAFCIEILLLQR